MLPLYDNIRRRRIELGLSQQELANMLGYTSRTTIAKIEAGAIDIPQSKIVAFANALNISPGSLMGWTKPENQALWRYTDIKNDKIVRNFPGLVNGENSAKALQQDFNSPLNLEITDDIISKDEMRILQAYRLYPDFKENVDRLLDDTFKKETISNIDMSNHPAPTRTIRISAYGGGITQHEFSATDKELQDAIDEGDLDPYPLK